MTTVCASLVCLQGAEKNTRRCRRGPRAWRCPGALDTESKSKPKTTGDVIKRRFFGRRCRNLIMHGCFASNDDYVLFIESCLLKVSDESEYNVLR